MPMNISHVEERIFRLTDLCPGTIVRIYDYKRHHMATWIPVEIYGTALYQFTESNYQMINTDGHKFSLIYDTEGFSYLGMPCKVSMIKMFKRED